MLLQYDQRLFLETPSMHSRELQNSVRSGGAADHVDRRQVVVNCERAAVIRRGTVAAFEGSAGYGTLPRCGAAVVARSFSNSSSSDDHKKSRSPRCLSGNLECLAAPAICALASKGNECAVTGLIGRALPDRADNLKT